MEALSSAAAVLHSFSFAKSITHTKCEESTSERSRIGVEGRLKCFIHAYTGDEKIAHVSTNDCLALHEFFT